MAAQAGYAPASYGGKKASIAGFAAQLQPAVTLTVLPSYGGGYGGAPAYGAARAYGAPQGSHGYGSVAIPISSGSAAGGVDADALRLASLVWALPSAGGPNDAIIDVPQYSSTIYTAPAVVLASGDNGNAVSGSSAAAAAANVKSASSGYGPAPAAPAYSAGSGYGPAPAASY